MTVNLIGDISFYDMNMYFFIYSFLGWIAEVVYSTLKTGKFVNRGFLNGPVCPIYGTGMAFLVLFLNTLADKWWLLFIVGATLATLLELFTGFILDKIFKTKWWDYSKEHFNIKGYVCLKFFFIWGFAVLLLFNTIVPITDLIINLIPYKYVGAIILTGLWLIFILDLITTIKQLKALKKDLDEVSVIAEKLHSNSDKLGEKVSEATIKVSDALEKLKAKIEKSRIVKAFPKLKGKDKDEKDKK